MRSTCAVIDLNALKKNFLGIRKKVKNAKLMAVVKADAYGHGAKEVSRFLNSLVNPPEYYGTALAQEGADLRKYKVHQPVLVFEPPNYEESVLILKNKLIPTIFSPEHLRILLKAKKDIKFSKQIPIHVKVDTGMNRIGVNYKEAESFINALPFGEVTLSGVYTHFASSDEKDKSFANLQLKRFKQVISSLNDKNIETGIIHAANSGAILDLPESYFDMVRPGISLYGYYPSSETSESIPLKPAMEIISKVNYVKTIEKGESVSYGKRFTAKAKTKIASVPIGYADGFPRNLTNKSKAIIGGKFFNQVGTVTMDRIMFDVKSHNTKIGDKVILIGKDKNNKIDAWDWSRQLDTIPYEITCGISKRIPRVYR